MIAEAKRFEKEEQLQMLAWAVAHIISYTGRLKKPVSPAKLLGKQKEYKVKQIVDKDKEWQELLKRFAE